MGQFKEIISDDEKNILSELGNNFKFHRREIKINQKIVAQKINSSVRSIIAIEEGSSSLRLIICIRLAKLYGIKLSKILEELGY